MKGGVLEVLVVSADGLKNAHLLGSSHHYVVVQCGSRTCTTKITAGKDHRVWWNEKFTFKLPSSESKDLNYLRFTVMEKDKLIEHPPVGETIIYVRSILREGDRKGSVELKPAPYNVVLEDGSYEGELKIGFKYISNVEMELEAEEKEVSSPEKQSDSFYCTIFNLTLGRIRWPRIFFFRRRTNRKECAKDN